jgi:hypothetical protein
MSSKKGNQVDPEVAEKFIKILKEEPDESLVETYSESFCFLLNKGRGNQAINALSFIENSLNNPKFSSPSVLKNLICALYGMLYFENRAETGKDPQLTKRLKTNVTTIGIIAQKSKNEELIAECLNFLAETGEEEAVTIIFRLIKNLPEEAYLDLEPIIKRRLFSSEWRLYHNFKNLILQKLIELKDYPHLKEREKKLEEYAKDKDLL